ncbi:sigma factor-like helix-turn-helix DNA-binding protein [Demequina phytophila]|uniref:sigma factor-like helix-turn-helix DNA-binding protein n=1 Tax=Demequina phytophila TaxID=1638981 RepID=UPI000783352F|nr:sigma-70 region 4 domain-containing protein [Demequina phytophila]
MGGTVAQLSEEAIARLGADAYLLTGSREVAERLLRDAAVHVAAERHPDGTLEARMRASLATRHLHHRHLPHRSLHRRDRRRPRAPRPGVFQLLDSLSPRQRAVLVLSVVDRLTVAEVARAIGEPEREVAATLYDLRATATPRAASRADFPGVARAVEAAPTDAFEYVDVAVRRRRGTP